MRIVLVLVLLAALSLALPVVTWRTGHEAFAPLALEQVGAARRLPQRVWIDTDAACGEPGWHDPDDCLALLALLGRPEVEVVGVSTVFGNAPAERTHRVAAQAVAQLRGGAVPVYRGCSAHFAECRSSDAVTALRAALAHGPLTILALGPVTNVARALGAATADQRAVAEVVAVMGRRPGHRFHPSENRAPRAWLFGHGPVFRDLNAALDPEAVTALLALQPRLTLVPYEAARQVVLDERDLARISARDAAGAWTAARCREWLARWRDRVGLDGFYPFDLVAAIYVLTPQRLDCAQVAVWVGRDPQLTIFDRAQAVLVTQGPVPQDRPVASAARYCTAVHARVGDVL